MKKGKETAEERILREFEKKVNKLRQLIPEDNSDSEVVEFGYKTLRHGTREIFTITDFGNIKNFIRQSLKDYKRELLEEIKSKMPKKRKIEYINLERTDDPSYEAGVEFNEAVDDISKVLADLSAEK